MNAWLRVVSESTIVVTTDDVKIIYRITPDNKVSYDVFNSNVDRESFPINCGNAHCLRHATYLSLVEVDSLRNAGFSKLSNGIMKALKECQGAIKSVVPIDMS